MKIRLISTLIAVITFLYTNAQTDFRALPGYNKYEGLAHVPRLLADMRMWAAQYPELIRETGNKFHMDSKGNCKLFNAPVVSTDPFFKSKELGKFAMKFDATVYEFEYTGGSTVNENASEHVSISMSSNSSNKGTAKRTTDTLSRQQKKELEDAVGLTLGTCILGEEKGMLFTNNAAIINPTPADYNKLYVIVYSDIEDNGCSAVQTLYLPVMISTGVKNPVNNQHHGPQIYYLAVLGKNAPSQGELNEHMVESMFHAGKPAPMFESNTTYRKTNLDHLDFVFNQGGENLYTILVDGMPIYRDISLSGADKKTLSLPLTPKSHAKITIRITNTGNLSGGTINVTCENVNIHSAFPFKKVNEEAYIDIERE